MHGVCICITFMDLQAFSFSGACCGQSKATVNRVSKCSL